MSKEKSKKELEKFIVSWDDIKDGLDRIREHLVSEGYYSDFDFKITFEIFDDGVISMLLVDRTKGVQHYVYHFDFIWDEKQNKYIGKRVSGM